MNDPRTAAKERPELPSNLVPRPVSASTDVVITHEDIDRAHDRERVRTTRSQRGLWPRTRLLWLLIGPGILVMLGENDGPSMLSYAATGARFGIGFFLPFVVLTFLMACVVQEMTVRLGSATHRGHAELIFDRFGPFWGWFSMIGYRMAHLLSGGYASRPNLARSSPIFLRSQSAYDSGCAWKCFQASCNRSPI